MTKRTKQVKLSTNEKAAMADRRERARGNLQIFETHVLVAIAKKEFDLNALARLELVSRGLDASGTWVGFAQAEKLALEENPSINWQAGAR